MPEHTIRPVLEDDLPALASIYAHYVAETAITFDVEARSLEAWREKWRAAQEQAHPWLLVQAEGKVAGYATSGTFNPKPSYRTSIETSIYLAPTRLGEGLGHPLYARLLELAAERSFHTAVAGITLPNERSVALHERLGFTRVGVFSEIGHKLGAWRDVGWWQRPLQLL